MLASHSKAAGHISQYSAPLIAASPRPTSQQPGLHRLQVEAAIRFQRVMSIVWSLPRFDAFRLVPRRERISSSLSEFGLDPTCEKRILCMKQRAVTAA